MDHGIGEAILGQQPLQIGFAVVRYFPHGGMQRTFLRMAQEAVRRGHKVTVLASSWEGDQPDEMTVRLLTVRACSNHGVNVAFGRALREERSRLNLDLVVGFNKLPGLDVYYAGDPCFAARCDEEQRSWLTMLLPRYRTYRQLEASCFGEASVTESLLIAHGELEKFQSHYKTLRSRIHLLPPGVDRGRLAGEWSADERESVRQEMGASRDDLLLMTIGSGFKTKGIDRTIRAIASLDLGLKSRIRFAVAGVGNESDYRRLAVDLGIGDQVKFLGPRDDVGSLLRATDLLVHPARVENTGTTLLESMICSTPVICSGNCGFANHVTDANGGWVLPHPFEQRSLEETLQRVLKTEDLAAKGAHGASYCKRTDLHSLIERGVDVIEEVAERLRCQSNLN